MLPLSDPVLEIVAAGGFVACAPVPLFPHAGAPVRTVFAGVEAAEVPHDQRLHQQHREGCDQGRPRPAGQPASAQAADHDSHRAAAPRWKVRLWLLRSQRRQEEVEVMWRVVVGGRRGGGAAAFWWCLEGGGGRRAGEDERGGEGQRHRAANAARIGDW